MTIEYIAAKPDRTGRFLVRFAGGRTLRLYRQTVEDFGLYAGLELSERQLSSLEESASQMSARMRAVRIVSASNVSRQDLKQRLVHKGESEEQAQAAVEWMEELNLLDDGETARQIVSHCIARGYGPARAKQALYEKKIPKELWAQALEDYPDQSEKMIDFLRSRLGEQPDQREIKRAVDALIRRGHSYGDIRRVLSRLSMDSEDILED